MKLKKFKHKKSIFNIKKYFKKFKRQDVWNHL